MPERQSIINYDSASVQGEGSWIKVRLISHGEQKQFTRAYGSMVGREIKDIDPQELETMQAANDALIVKNVIAWNWVDDDGEPLALPKDDPTVVDELTEFEHQFIADAMKGEGDRKK